MSKSSPATKHFVFLDTLRGLAALWVVLFHIRVSNNALENLAQLLPNWIVTIVFDWGQYGVLIFFVLSGFVIAHSLRNVRFSLSTFKRFLLRRWVRLTPPYYAAIALILAFSAYQAIKGWNTFLLIDSPNPLARFASHLLYLQELLGFQSYDNIYWTLCLEAQFYIVCALLLWLSQKLSPRLPYSRLLVFGSWTAFGTLYNLGFLPLPFYSPLFLPWQYSFFLGVYAYWAWQRQWHPFWVYGYAAFVALSAPVNFAFGLTSGLTAAGILAIAQAGKLSTWMGHRALQYLGVISYSLYLTHVPIQADFFYRWLAKYGRGIPQECLGLFATVGVCLLSATIFWAIFEKPSMILSQRLKKKAPSPRTAH